MPNEHHNVRYVGPTTHLNDHRLVHAAKGMSHIWTASIVAGFAVVLTGAIAYASIEAKSAQAAAVAADPAKAELHRLNQRLDVLELKMQRLNGKLAR